MDSPCGARPGLFAVFSTFRARDCEPTVAERAELSSRTVTRLITFRTIVRRTTPCDNWRCMSRAPRPRPSSGLRPCFRTLSGANPLRLTFIDIDDNAVPDHLSTHLGWRSGIPVTHVVLFPQSDTTTCRARRWRTFSTSNSDTRCGPLPLSTKILRQ